MMPTYKQPQKNPNPQGEDRLVKTSQNEFGKPKTSGIKIRGTGAATKGVKARGPMA